MFCSRAGGVAANFEKKRVRSLRWPGSVAEIRLLRLGENQLREKAEGNAVYGAKIERRRECERMFGG